MISIKKLILTESTSTDWQNKAESTYPNVSVGTLDLTSKDIDVFIVTMKDGTANLKAAPGRMKRTKLSVRNQSNIPMIFQKPKGKYVIEIDGNLYMFAKGYHYDEGFPIANVKLGGNSKGSKKSANKTLQPDWNVKLASDYSKGKHGMATMLDREPFLYKFKIGPDGYLDYNSLRDYEKGRLSGTYVKVPAKLKAVKVWDFPESTWFFEIKGNIYGLIEDYVQNTSKYDAWPIAEM